MKLFRIFLCLVFICSIIYFSLYAQEKTFIIIGDNVITIPAEGIAYLGSGINEDLAKTLAIKDAKRNALEKAGTYLESHTTVLNYQIVKDEIITFTGGLVQVKIINEKREIINNMFALKVKIKAYIDIKLLNERIAEIRNNSELKKQIQSQRMIIQNLENKIAQLQTVSNSKNQIKKLVNELTSNEWFEKGYFAKEPNQKLKCFKKFIELEPDG